METPAKNSSSPPKFHWWEIALLVLVVGYGIYAYQGQQWPFGATIATPTPSATSDWQTYKNEEYGYMIEIPKDWQVGCSSDQYRKTCRFYSPQEIEDINPLLFSLPPASLTIFEVVDDSTSPDFGEKLSDVKMGENIFSRYEVRDSGFMYGLAHGNAYFYFYGHDPQILATFKAY